MNRVVIIGSGNLAEALAKAVSASGLQLVQVFGRNAARAKTVAEAARTAWTSDPAGLAGADIYLLAVSDRAVAEVADSLPIPASAVVAHTAGSVPIDAIPARYPRRAVFYPMQTFTAGRAVDFRQIPIFLETSSGEFYGELETFAQKLSDTVVRANGDQRARIHLAAVFACNFSNNMYAIAERIVRDAGFSFGILKALIAETAAKACAAPSPADVQTGPAARNDAETQERHCAMLHDNPELEEIYKIISKHIWETSKKI